MNIDHTFKKMWINKQTINGWKHLTFYNKDDKFLKWLDENVEYKTNSILKLSDVCELYLGEKVGPRVMTKYKNKIEKYIKKNYKNLNANFQHTTINGINYKGWINLGLKNNTNNENLFVLQFIKKVEME